MDSYENENENENEKNDKNIIKNLENKVNNLENKITKLEELITSNIEKKYFTNFTNFSANENFDIPYIKRMNAFNINQDNYFQLNN